MTDLYQAEWIALKEALKQVDKCQKLNKATGEFTCHLCLRAVPKENQCKYYAVEFYG